MRGVVFISVFFLMACGSGRHLTTEALVGTYEEENNFYGVNSSIVLNGDSTFLYKWVVGLEWGETKGLWQIEGKKLIFNSEGQPIKDRPKYKVVKRLTYPSDSLKIKVMEPDSSPIWLAVCVLKKDSSFVAGAETDSLGIAHLPFVEADSLLIRYIGHEDVLHALESGVTYYEFIMKPTPPWYIYFTDEVWKVKKEKLYKPMRYEYYKKRIVFKRVDE